MVGDLCSPALQQLGPMGEPAPHSSYEDEEGRERPCWSLFHPEPCGSSTMKTDSQQVLLSVYTQKNSQSGCLLNVLKAARNLLTTPFFFKSFWLFNRFLRQGHVLGIFTSSWKIWAIKRTFGKCHIFIYLLWDLSHRPDKPGEAADVVQPLQHFWPNFFISSFFFSPLDWVDQVTEFS